MQTTKGDTTKLESSIELRYRLRDMSHQPNNIFAGTEVVSLIELPWAEVDAWGKEPHRDFERALAETKLPERADYEAANRFLIKARREM